MPSLLLFLAIALPLLVLAALAEAWAERRAERRRLASLAAEPCPYLTPEEDAAEPVRPAFPANRLVPGGGTAATYRNLRVTSPYRGTEADRIFDLESHAREQRAAKLAAEEDQRRRDDYDQGLLSTSLGMSLFDSGSSFFDAGGGSSFDGFSGGESGGAGGGGEW